MLMHEACQPAVRVSAAACLGVAAWPHPCSCFTHAAALEEAPMHSCLLSRASRACCCDPSCAVAHLPQLQGATLARWRCRRCMGRKCYSSCGVCNVGGLSGAYWRPCTCGPHRNKQQSVTCAHGSCVRADLRAIAGDRVYGMLCTPVLPTPVAPGSYLLIHTGLATGNVPSAALRVPAELVSPPAASTRGLLVSVCHWWW